MSFAIYHDPWLASPALMTAPTPASTGGEVSLVGSPVLTPATATDTTGISFTVDLPDGSNVVGRLLVVCVGKDGTGAVTWPATFTAVKNETDGVEIAASIAYRFIDGTEGYPGAGASIAVTGASEQWGAVAYLVSGADSGEVPEASTVATSTGLTPDPSSLTPSWGSARNLWIAFWAKNIVTAAQTGVPTGFTDAGSTQTSGSGTMSTGSAYRFYEGTSLDPSNFTVPDNSNVWMAYTIAVAPDTSSAPPSGGDYATIVAADSPIGWFRLGESSGTTAADTSATANDGTYAGTPTLAQTGLVGDADTAVTFDGVDDAVAIPDHAAYDFALGDYSLEAWLKFSTWPGGGSKTYILSVGDPTIGTGFEIECSGVANRFNSRIYGVASVYSATTSTIADGQPHHVVVTMDRDGLAQWYLDGLAYGAGVDISSASAISLTAEGTLYIGRRAAGNYISGTLDEVTIYDRLLTPTEVVEHYNAGVS